MSFLRRSLLALLVVCITAAVLPMSGARAGETDPAAAVVEHFHTVLINTMKAKGKNALERRQILAPVIEKTFDFPRMTRIVTGASAWGEADEAQRQRLVKAFSDLNVSIYAAQFHDWSGQRFETVGVEPGPRQARLVHTRLVLPKDPAVDLTYVMTPAGKDGWQASDILINGSISQLATRRADYARTLGAGGLDALSALLEKQATDLTKDRP
ncbi:ABC transporter substrate-binding protein [Phaeovibrio sulfidiphilus]|uniref:ABC transporter substrate-binding protein n=1 Tax=Phaeovibrio sulfidiphilus TaxID=1220600 RepID=A0A8J6YPK1_9PROT|nr:ABC transporter substrate-binding protein [Phaeovibrio sulfidiphilus]MBE1237286.1 ABC transporter substrate-binding protein [Phaeovibrio sulfidiphilus]